MVMTVSCRHLMDLMSCHTDLTIVLPCQGIKINGCASQAFLDFEDVQCKMWTDPSLDLATLNIGSWRNGLVDINGQLINNNWKKGLVDINGRRFGLAVFDKPRHWHMAHKESERKKIQLQEQQEQKQRQWQWQWQ